MHKIIAYSLLFSGATAQAVTIGFDDLDNGRVVNSQYSALGVTISAVNASTGTGGDYAVAFDTNPDAVNGNEDDDLLSPFTSGNIDFNTVLGNVLIIQENHVDGEGTMQEGCASGVCSFPDDEADRPAGSLFFDFDYAITDFGLDLVDIEGPDEWVAGGYLASFEDGLGASLGTVNFADFIATDAAEYGDNSLNRIAPIDLTAFGDVRRVELMFGGSGAVDNITFSQVPEPGIIALIVAGIFGAGLSRRKKLV